MCSSHLGGGSDSESYSEVGILPLLAAEFSIIFWIASNIFLWRHEIKSEKNFHIMVAWIISSINYKIYVILIREWKDL